MANQGYQYRQPPSAHELAAIDSGFTTMPIIPYEWIIDGVANAINDGWNSLTAGDIGGAVVSAVMGVGKSTPVGKVLHTVEDAVGLNRFSKSTYFE